MEPQLQQSGIFVLAIFLAILSERGWQSLLRRCARRWPAADGRVHRADWRQPRTGTNRYFIGELSYYYFVAGQFYSGYYRRSFSKASDAEEWVRRMRSSTIQVRYKPAPAGRSLFLEEEQRQVPAFTSDSSIAENRELAAAGD